ncbi:MAG: hypothetical protein KKC14_16270 [Alphaproteobacteria bacterium]|nr:hypothetical protein [Alphaproteobacteria bacterium]
MDDSNCKYHSRHLKVGLPRMNPRMQTNFSFNDLVHHIDLEQIEDENLDKSKILYRWIGLFLSTLIKRRNYYSGDLDQFMIHMVLVLGEIKAMNVAADARSRSAAPPAAVRGVNVQSLSDITRIPRESVRRKLTMLIESGLVRRNADGLLYVGPSSDLNAFFEDLSPLLRSGARLT